MKILLLSKFGRLGASSRMRSLQYLPLLESSRFQITLSPLICDEMLSARYKKGRYGFFSLLRAYFNRYLALKNKKQFDLIWIEKEVLPWIPLWVEQKLLRGALYLLDYDDAIFHNYDQHKSVIARRLLGRKLDGLMAGATLVVGGNDYLMQRARDAGAPKVEFLPTVIDLPRYPLKRVGHGNETADSDGLLRIVWIGSPSTAPYLRLLERPLQALAERHPFVLRIIGGGAFDLPKVRTEIVQWSEETEVDDISACDIGIMPLNDSLWERGKCGYKLVQYMACGLPTVASGVGVNSEIVREGDNGFIANSDSDWLTALTKLLENPALRTQMGSAGRRRVEEEYCVQRTAPRLAELLDQAGDDTQYKNRAVTR